MPLTENELRDLLHQRTADAPASPDRVAAVRTRVAKQRRRELAGVAAAMAVVVGAGVLWALPRNAATPAPPANPTPTVSEGSLVLEEELNGLKMRTTGPAEVQADEPFTLTLEVTNPGSQDWTGEVGVGLVREAVPAPAGFFLLMPDDPMIEPAPTVLTGFTSELGEGRAFDGATTNLSVTVPSGGSTTWSVTLRRNLEAPVIGTPAGWTGYALPFGSGASPDVDPVGDAGRALAIAPRGSTLACFEVSELTWERTGDQEWRLGFVEEVLVEEDGARPVIGNASASDLVEVRLDEGSADAPAWAVLRALDSAATGASTTSGLAAVAVNPEAFPQAGTFVFYSAASMVDIRFSGTCLPSGETVSGVASLNGDGAVSGGIVDCATGPEATPAARLAAAYCKTG